MSRLGLSDVVKIYALCCYENVTIVIACGNAFPLIYILVFKWVRRTLIALVQVTFGRTINK